MNALRSKSLWIVLGTVLGVALLLLFLRRAGDLGGMVDVLRGAASRPGWLAAGIGLFSVSLLFGLTRWYLLLRALGLPLRFRGALRLYATGHFFNVLGPGATGGDLVKAGWIAARCPGRRTEAIASIAADRLIGLLSMVVFVAAVSVLRADFFSMDPALALLRHFVYVGRVVGAAVVLLFAFLDIGAFVERLRLPEKSLRSRLADVAVRFWRTLHVCLTHPRAALGAFALSLCNLSTTVCCYFLLSRSLSMTVPLRDLFVLTPLADTIAAVPVTPGGAGLRENTLQSLLDIASVPRTESTALALAMFGTILVWAAVAGILMVSGPKRDLPK